MKLYALSNCRGRYGLLTALPIILLVIDDNGTISQSLYYAFNIVDLCLDYLIIRVRIIIYLV